MQRAVLTFLSTLILSLLGTAALAQTAQPSPPPAPPFGMPITLEQAQKVIDAAQAQAVKMKLGYAFAVVEPSGDLVYFRKMTGAPYSAIQLAQGKAVTAARYRRPTKFLFDQVEAGHQFFMTFPGALPVPGGMPIVADGKLIGAIGVSGGNSEQDMEIATPAANALQ
jgi:glc operon protein GlcG